jgi:hypothetical protein
MKNTAAQLAGATIKRVFLEDGPTVYIVDVPLKGARRFDSQEEAERYRAKVMDTRH